MELDDGHWADLPGGDRVAAGLRQLRRGHCDAEGLAVLIAAPRLTQLGVAVPEHPFAQANPELRLYRLLEATHGEDAHHRYNAQLREIDSFAHAFEKLEGPSKRAVDAPLPRAPANRRSGGYRSDNVDKV